VSKFDKENIFIVEINIRLFSNIELLIASKLKSAILACRRPDCVKVMKVSGDISILSNFIYATTNIPQICNVSIC
jgi:hypothetical protein